MQEISHHQDEERWQPDDDQPEVVSDSSYQDELAEKQSLVHFTEPLLQVSPTPQETPSSPAYSLVRKTTKLMAIERLEDLKRNNVT